MSWTNFKTWASRVLTNIHDAITALRTIADANTLTLHRIHEEIHIMSENETAAFAKLTDDLNKVVAGWTAKDALIAALQADNATLLAEVANFDADKAAAVAAALTADSVTDTAAIDTADAIVDGLVNPPVEPPVEQPPTDQPA